MSQDVLSPLRGKGWEGCSERRDFVVCAGHSLGRCRQWRIENGTTEGGFRELREKWLEFMGKNEGAFGL